MRWHRWKWQIPCRQTHQGLYTHLAIHHHKTEGQGFLLQTFFQPEILFDNVEQHQFDWFRAVSKH